MQTKEEAGEGRVRAEGEGGAGAARVQGDAGDEGREEECTCVDCKPPALRRGFILECVETTRLDQGMGKMKAFSSAEDRQESSMQSLARLRQVCNEKAGCLLTVLCVS